MSDAGHHSSPARRAYDTAYDAAIEAEERTGHHEPTLTSARRSLGVRLARTTAGFLLIGVGIAGLVLPGPGWVVVLLGLGLLPYSWARRTVREIRRRVPGIPKDGRIPASTWVLMGVVVAATSALTIAFGAEVSVWLAGLWGDPQKLFG